MDQITDKEIEEAIHVIADLIGALSVFGIKVTLTDEGIIWTQGAQKR